MKVRVSTLRARKATDLGSVAQTSCLNGPLDLLTYFSHLVWLGLGLTRVVTLIWASRLNWIAFSTSASIQMTVGISDNIVVTVGLVFPR